MAERIDVAALLANARTGARDSHFAHMNPAFAKLVELIGFDRTYVRGEGQYLWDAQGRRVLDCLAEYQRVLKGQGNLFLSGLREEDVPMILEKAQSLNLDLQETQIIEGWVMMMFENT